MTIVPKLTSIVTMGLLLAAITGCAQQPRISSPAIKAAPSDGSWISQYPPTAFNLYRDDKFGFEMAVPNGWYASNKGYMLGHSHDIFLSIDNKRADLRMQAQPTLPGHLEFNPDVAFNLLLPGEVYVMVAHVNGPGDGNMALDNVGADLHEPLRNTQFQISKDVQGLTTYSLPLFKRGKQWAIVAYLRDPIAATDQQAVMKMLESWRFIDQPVSNIDWAESLAFTNLPPAVRDPLSLRGWPRAGIQNGSRSVTVTQSPSGYEVAFLDTEAGSWRYVVSTQGTVTKLDP